MTTRKARVYVTLKSEVLDPQGDAVRRALGVLGFQDVQKVRVGKLIELELDGTQSDQRKELTAMCEKLLVNPIIEDFSFELDETS
jgi:phosphoribosylformylglycinamidine synthase subunit PurS